MAPIEPLVPEVLSHWSALRGGAASRFGTGLINDTWRVDAPAGVFVLQRLHKAFGPSVHDDIAAVTAHLAAQAMPTPRLVPSDAGALWVSPRGAPETVWRVQTFVPGSRAFDKVTGPAMAAEAGALVGRWHRAMQGFAHRYAHRRGGVHDTAAHLERLHRALAAPRDRTYLDEVRALADEVTAAYATLPDLRDDPLRHCHGDLKLSNLLFDEAGRGLCLIDLDTLGEMRLAHELGDALRSWCNRAGEDSTEAIFDVAVFTAAVQGFFESAAGCVSPRERAHLVGGLRALCLELTMRFLEDTVLASYFGYNAEKYPSRAAHNRVRALGQWSLYRAVTRDAAALEAVVASIAP
ncbi:MAG: phosphotransferase [Myxococcales bacterium]|nr:phosphotransferase [Myxococcales bacterium]